MPVINFNNRGVSHLQLAIGVSSTEIKIPWADFSQFINPQAIDGDTMWAVLRDPIVREIVKIDLANSNLNEATAFLKVERAQGGTTAQMWPAGTLIFLTTHADHYESLFQPDGTRQIDFNPNGVVSPLYRGEKILQYAGCGVRWWMSFDAVNPYWQLIAGEPCVDEEYIDTGFGFKVWIVAELECFRPYFDDTHWEPLGGNPTNGVFTGTLWESDFNLFLEDIGIWASGYRPSFCTIYRPEETLTALLRLYDTNGGLLNQISSKLIGPDGFTFEVNDGDDYFVDLGRLLMTSNGPISGKTQMSNLEFYDCVKQTAGNPFTTGYGGQMEVRDPDFNTARTAPSCDGFDWESRLQVGCQYRWWVGGDPKQYGFNRSWLVFDLSGITITEIDRVRLKLFQYAVSGGSSMVLQESSATFPITCSDWNNFSGPILADPEPMINGNQEIYLNQDGIDLIAANLGGEVWICMREFEADYSGIAPPYPPDAGGWASYNGNQWVPPPTLEVFGEI